MEMLSSNYIYAECGFNFVAIHELEMSQPFFNYPFTNYVFPVHSLSLYLYRQFAYCMFYAKLSQ